MLFPFIKQGEDIFQYLEQLKNEEQEGLSLLLLVKGKKVTVLSKIEFKKKVFLFKGLFQYYFKLTWKMCFLMKRYKEKRASCNLDMMSITLWACLELWWAVDRGARYHNVRQVCENLECNLNPVWSCRLSLISLNCSLNLSSLKRS